MEKCTHSLSWYAKRMWQLCPAEEAALRWHRCISIWRCCCCNLLSSFYYDSNWPTSGGQAGKVSFVFQLSRVFNFTFGSLKKCTYRIYTYLSHSSTQATHLHATAYDHDAGEDNRGVHATHLEAHQHTLPAAHASRPDVHARSTGARTGLPGCHQAQVDTAHDLRLLHGLDPWDAPLGCVHETWVERNGAYVYIPNLISSSSFFAQPFAPRAATTVAIALRHRLAAVRLASRVASASRMWMSARRRSPAISSVSIRRARTSVAADTVSYCRQISRVVARSHHMRMMRSRHVTWRTISMIRTPRWRRVCRRSNVRWPMSECTRMSCRNRCRPPTVWWTHWRVGWAHWWVASFQKYPCIYYT